jgi:hypothetical protein
MRGPPGLIADGHSYEAPVSNAHQALAMGRGGRIRGRFHHEREVELISNLAEIGRDGRFEGLAQYVGMTVRR